MLANYDRDCGKMSEGDELRDVDLKGEEKSKNRFCDILCDVLKS
jgi:hypothetical protein